jgi:N-acetylglucosaminyldiphosphoundecaprenol N-acetyl-beta-D-mannosaminyltransferase
MPPLFAEVTLTKLSPGSPPRFDVLGVQVSATNMAEAVSTIMGWIEKGERHYVCVTGVHGVMESQRDEELLRIHKASGLTVPDGMPMVWAGRLHGFPRIGRVFGPELMMKVCGLSVEKGYSHFLYGGAPGVADELRHRLQKKFPDIKIVGAFTPPFRPLVRWEEEQLIDQVARAKPDIFWVGLSCPKNERFMDAYFSKLDTKVMLGVGAAFDFHTGRAQDAPALMKKTGLQWLHRLCQEPGRLWKRYLINNPIFVAKFLRQLISSNQKFPAAHRKIDKP